MWNQRDRFKRATSFSLLVLEEYIDGARTPEEVRMRTNFESNVCRQATFQLVRGGYLVQTGWVEAERGRSGYYLPTGKTIRVCRAKRFWNWT